MKHALEFPLQAHGLYAICKNCHQRFSLAAIMVGKDQSGCNVVPRDMLVGGITSILITLPLTTKCECGAEKCGSPMHSHWCQKYQRPT